MYRSVIIYKPIPTYAMDKTTTLIQIGKKEGEKEKEQRVVRKRQKININW